MVDIQSATAEIRRGKKEEEEERRKKKERKMTKLECGPMSNVVAALPNIGDASVQRRSDLDIVL